MAGVGVDLGGFFAFFDFAGEYFEHFVVVKRVSGAGGFLGGECGENMRMRRCVVGRGLSWRFSCRPGFVFAGLLIAFYCMRSGIVTWVGIILTLDDAVPSATDRFRRIGRIAGITAITASVAAAPWG